jgi:glucose/arabinose dehydrogenase
MKTTTLLSAAVAAFQPYIVYAASIGHTCPPPSGNAAPAVAAGYKLQAVAKGLAGPRGIVFDAAGHLLVVEADKDSITAHTVTEANGCTSLTDPVTVIGPGNGLNYGIQAGGPRIYASSADKVFTWDYNVGARTASKKETLVTGMNTDGPAIRPLRLSGSVYNNIIVGRPAAPDFDPDSTSIPGRNRKGGTAQVRSYDLSSQKRNYKWQDGTVIAWGIRNPSGLVEHPTTGSVWSVESGSDKVVRNGADVSAHNPADELNDLGRIGSPKGANFGYPFCHAVWAVDDLPNHNGLAVGNQFAMDSVPQLGGQKRTDQDCKATTGPRLSFEAHNTPVDLEFNDSGNELWVAFFGAWGAKGGKVSIVDFANGQPVQPASSKSATRDIVSKGDQRFLSAAFDKKGRLFISTLAGDILMVSRV